MCGIAGIFYRSGQTVDKGVLKKMTDIIHHRGPDGEGHWLNQKGNIGFGHRRLSIIDLSDNGKQPMHYLDGRYTITFNGEIYNYIEIKEQLLKQGYKFRSDSDTEVLLALYDRKKEKCLEDLDGMFAFAIWDEVEQILFCARDRFGEKPFHYFYDGTSFIFGSEIKQIWAYGVKREVEEKRAFSFINNGLLENESDITDTYYKNIKRLDAAHYIVLNSNNKLVQTKYWAINNSNVFKGTIEEAAEKFLELFKEAIRIRLRSDVPVGSSLSGGLDSSSIVMLIDQLKGAEINQNTFSARFKNFAKDEGKHIEEVVKACKNVQVHYTWPDKDYFNTVLNDVIYHQDEPFGSASIVAQYAVMQLAKEKNVTVLLDRQRADEQLAGYLPYYKVYLDQLYYNNRSLYNKEIEAYNKLHAGLFPYTPVSANETLRMKLGWYKKRLLGQALPYSHDELRRQLVADTTSNGLKQLLRYADRNSMAHSREVRLPFLSHKLCEFIFSLPNEYKINSGWTKYVLRKAMDKILPHSICWRVDKIGYEPPQNEWLNSQNWNDEIEKASRHFDVKVVENPGDTYVKSQKWRLLMAYKYA